MKDIYYSHYDPTPLTINRRCRLKPNSMSSNVFDKIFESGVSDNGGLTGGFFHGFTYANLDVVGYHKFV